MLTRILTLIGFWILCAGAWASPPDLLLNLKSRLHPLSSNSSLIQSYINHTQSYIYDQALATIAFTKVGDQATARSLLNAMAKLQRKDGSLYFSYYLNGKSPYPVEGDKRYAGAIAWVALAAVQFQNEFKSKEFLGFNQKLLSYLSSQMTNIEIEGDVQRALRFSPSDVKETTWNENEVAALEHNLDAYAAFSHFQMLNPESDWKFEITALKSFSLSLWDKRRSHFWSGVNLKTGQINKDELYLDNQTWSLLALDKETLKGLKMSEALKLNCETFIVEHEGITGFTDSKSVRSPAAFQFVWSEGTLGQVLAMKKHQALGNEKLSCGNRDARDFLKDIEKMQKPDGGIAYATPSAHPDFSSVSSVAGTAWFYFASNDINPFQLN